MLQSVSVAVIATALVNNSTRSVEYDNKFMSLGVNITHALESSTKLCVKIPCYRMSVQ